MWLVWIIVGLLILCHPDAVGRVKAILAKRDLRGIGMRYRIATMGAQSGTTPAPSAG